MKTASEVTGTATPSIGTAVAEIAELLSAELPESLVKLWSDPQADIGGRLYDPVASSDEPMSVAAALQALETAPQRSPDRLVPVTYVDDRSLACVVCRPREGPPPAREGQVIRWHLDDIPPQHQGALLDLDVYLYAQSLSEELGPAWGEGYEGMVQTAKDYQEKFLQDEQVTPKARDLRPFQLACQNVIIGLAAVRHDPVIDGLRVKYWQTCEVPHALVGECREADVDHTQTRQPADVGDDG